MIKGIALLMLAIGLGLLLPNRIQEYKSQKKTEDLLELLGIILLIPGSLILAIAQFV